MIFVPVGLPGAGKTYIYGSMFNYCTYINGDKYFKDGKSLDNLISDVEKLSKTTRYIYMDGLFTSKEVQDKIQKKLDVAFIYFIPNKERCKFNDKNRDREHKSTARIDSIHVNKPYHIYTTLETNCSDLVSYLDDTIYQCLESDTWTIEGSTYGDCWSNTVSEVPEEIPLELDEFTPYVDFLKKHIPGFLRNKEMYIEKYSYLIEEKEDSESDYYGGCVYYRFYSVSARDLLADILKHEYGITDLTLENAKENNPELFI